MRGPTVHLVAALGVALSLVGAAPPANACGEEIAPVIDYRIQGVSRAEDALQRGHYVAAAGSVLRMFPEIKTAAAGKDGLLDRAARTLALATARAGGSLPVDREVPAWLASRWSGKTAADRTANLEWAASAMRRLNDHRKDDPGVQTDLGEVLSKLDSHGDEATTLLGGLAEKDLLASPEGYAALAKMRQRAGDAAGSEAAMKRCEGMTQAAGTCHPAIEGSTQS